MALIMTLIRRTRCEGCAARHRRRDRPRLGNQRRTGLARAGSGVRSADRRACRPPWPNAPRAKRSARPRSTLSCSRSQGRRKRLLVADLESTIIENEMLDELADFVGLRAQIAEITRRAMNGELDFAAALAERVALLRGLPISVLDDAAERIRIMPGARVAASRHRAPPACAPRWSPGGFTVFAEPVAASLGFDRGRRQPLDIADGRIAGTVRTADRRSGRQARRARRARGGRGRPARGDAGGRRRRQRSADAAGGRARRRVPCQTGGRRRGALAHRARRSDGAALCPGLPGSGNRSRLMRHHPLRVPHRPRVSPGRGAARKSADRPGDRPAAGSNCGRPAWLRRSSRRSGPRS